VAIRTRHLDLLQASFPAGNGQRSPKSRPVQLSTSLTRRPGPTSASNGAVDRRARKHRHHDSPPWWLA